MRGDRSPLALYSALSVIVLDQISKWFVMYHLVREHEVLRLTPFLNFVHLWNRGMTFGFLSGRAEAWLPHFLVGLSVLIIILLLRWLWQSTAPQVAIALGLVMGGAVGNVADRIAYGAVFDFIDFHILSYHWYAFNVADSAIVIGVFMLMIDSLIRGRK